MPSNIVHLLDSGAGNVRSLVNAVRHLGCDVVPVKCPADLINAKKLLFPGVGEFGTAMNALEPYREALLQYLASGKPFLGICVGLQSLFSGSEESPDTRGFGYFDARVRQFDNTDKVVPHMGWNTCQSNATPSSSNEAASIVEAGSHYYFVHSYAVRVSEMQDQSEILAWTEYGGERFVSAVQRGNVVATQFHPEKSGPAGLQLLAKFLGVSYSRAQASPLQSIPNGFTKRVIACLDVRADDSGRLVVTKGDQYNVRDKNSGQIRDLGDPTELAARYYEMGADEVCFLNITSFRDLPLRDMPMLQMLQNTSERVFVPLTIGGGIRDFTDLDGRVHTAADVAGQYFRSGADKVSIGSDAVYAAEKYLASGKIADGTSSLETISRRYGRQAVVVSIDPKRVYVNDPSETRHHCVKAPYPGPQGESWCWYQCTVRGGRDSRDLDVRQLVQACEALGAGEFLVNCMDQDGTGLGFDMALLDDVRAAVRVPVVASSGAGSAQHFVDVFKQVDVEAALAAGIFHRGEVEIGQVKAHLANSNLPIRLT